MTAQEMMMILGPSLAGGIGSAVNNSQQNRQNQQNQQNTQVQQQMAALAQKAQMLQGLQQNRQQNAQSGLNAMPLGQEQAYASRAKAMQALLPMLAKYQGARPTDPGIAGSIRSSGPNLVQGLAGNAGFQNTFSDQMTSQAMADRRKAVAGVNPDYEFSSLGGYGMDSSYDQTVNDARSSALGRLEGFEGQQKALADQQVQLAMQPVQQQQEKKGGGIGGFLGGLMKTAAPFAAFIPGVGPLAAIGLGAAGGAIGNKLQGGGLVSGALQGGIGAGVGAAGKSLASGQGLNPFNNGAGRVLNNSMTAASLPQMGIGAPGQGPQLQLPNNMPQQMSPFKQGVQQQMPQLPMFNKADPRGGSMGQQPPSGMNPNSGIPMRNAMPYSGPGQPQGQQQGQHQPGRNMNIGERSLMSDFFSPLTNIPSQAAGWMADKIDAPTNPMTPYPMINQMNAMGKGFLAGATQGVGNIMDGMTSPASIATMGVGAGIGAARGGLGAGLSSASPKPLGLSGVLTPPGNSIPQRTAQFNQMWQQGMAKPSLPVQQNARSMMQTLSANNGMSAEQKAAFLASPEGQRIMRMIVGGQ